MAVIAGIDIGNSTTEVALGRVEGGRVNFLSSSIAFTSGIKGTTQNVLGVRNALSDALERAGWGRDDFSKVDLIRINRAAPVIGEVAMETVTETIITESTMIGHNPSTPGGVGVLHKGGGGAVLLSVRRQPNDQRPGAGVEGVAPGEEQGGRPADVRRHEASALRGGAVPRVSEAGDAGGQPERPADGADPHRDLFQRSDPLAAAHHQGVSEGLPQHRLRAPAGRLRGDRGVGAAGPRRLRLLEAARPPEA